MRSRILFFTSLLFAAACSGGSSNPGDGGTDSGAAGDGAAGACSAVAAPQKLADLPSTTLITQLGFVGDALVVQDPRGGLDTGVGVFPKTGEILRLPKAGGAASSFHVPATKDLAVSSLVADGTQAWFVQAPVLDASKGAFFRRGAMDATATQVGMASYDGLVSYIAGVDASALYATVPGTNGTFRGVRVDRTSGAETVLAELPSLQFGQAQIYQGFYWFYATQGAGALYKAPLGAMGASQTKVTDTTCFGGGLLLSSDGFFCGSALRVERFADETFSAPATIFDVLDAKLDGSGPRPHAIVGSNAIVSLRVGPASRTQLLLVPKGGGAFRPLACDVAQIETVRVDGGYAYWLERRAATNGAPESVAAYRTPIPM